MSASLTSRARPLGQVGASFKDAAVEGVDFTGARMDVTTDFSGAIGVDKVAAWPAGYSPPLG